MNMKYVFGIDIGGTSIKMGLFGEGRLIEKYSIISNTQEKGKYVLGDIAKKINQIFKERHIHIEDVLGFGFGVPGPVSHNKVIKCANLGWENVDVEKEFKAIMGDVKVLVANDATVAAYGEYTKLNIKEDIVFITLGTGVGGGIIIDDKWLEGAFGAGGEIGHMIIDKTGVPCGCGQRGCLETICGKNGWIRLAKECIDLGVYETKLDRNNLDPRAIHTLAKQGDQVGIEVVKKVADALGYACSIIAAIVNPHTFIIGGGISNAGYILMDNLKASFNKYAFYGVKDAQFKLAELSNDAGMYGCYYMVMKK